MSSARPVRLPKWAKYRAVPTDVDGIRFASKKEAMRYAELKLMEDHGAIVGLRLQPIFEIWVDGLDEQPHRIGKYVADFAYRHKVSDPRETIEDCKGVRTAVYRLKKKLVEALYGIKIRET